MFIFTYLNVNAEMVKVLTVRAPPIKYNTLAAARSSLYSA